MRAENQPDDLRIQQRYEWLMKNGWADDLGRIVVVYQEKKYRPGLGMRDAFLRPAKIGGEKIEMSISDYYDLVLSMQITHPGDKPQF